MNDPEEMHARCPDVCRRWHEDQVKYSTYSLDDSDASLYDINVVNATYSLDDSDASLYDINEVNTTGHTMSFKSFEKYADVEVEEPEDCFEKAVAGECMNDPEEMHARCPDVCRRWHEDQVKYSTYSLDDSDASLYDINVVNATGHTINFERFEGYVTLVLPIAKTCDGAKVPAANLLQSIEDLKSVYPYTVEILVFPFEHPSKDYDGLDCSHFEEEIRKEGKHIQVMDFVHLNGPGAHPLFDLFRSAMNILNFNLDEVLYFVVLPDFDKFEIHWGKSLVDMRDVLRVLVKELNDEL